MNITRLLVTNCKCGAIKPYFCYVNYVSIRYGSVFCS